MTDGQMRKRRKKENERTEDERKKKANRCWNIKHLLMILPPARGTKIEEKNLTKLKCARKVFVGLQKNPPKKTTHSKQRRNPAITAISHQPAGALHMLMPLQPVTLIFMASLSTQPDIMLACHRHDLWPQWLSALMKL